MGYSGMGLISDRLARLAPSPTVTITDMAMNMRRAGRDVIGLGAGEPDFDTPDHIKQAAIAAMRDGKTKYTQVDGIPELKEAICRKFARENNIQSTPDMISVGTGGKQVLFNMLLASLNPGDEVVIPVPYWVSFAGIVQFAEAVPVYLRPASKTLKFTPDELTACITEKTKWLILNSPSNPSGAGYTSADLINIAEVLRQHPQVYVVCDDIYEHLTYDNFSFASLTAVAPDLQSRVVTLNGVSKSYCMTGWRIGYCTAPPDLVNAMARVQSQSTSSPNSIAQWAAIAALDGPVDFIADNCRAFAARRQLLCDALNAMPGVSCAPPDGAFYVYPSISGLMGKTRPDGQVIETDADFVSYLLEAGEVAVVPGIAFGLSPYFRISYAASDAVLAEAMSRVGRIVNSLT
jgi:aspartate aminotransferase